MAITGVCKKNSIKQGMVLGKFYPPHQGHQYLIAFARQYVDELTVIVEAMPDEWIPAKCRIAWLQSLFRDVKFLLLADYNPQDPSETPAFWEIWQASLLRLMPNPPDFVFASEEYGEPLAACLGATFIPVDPQRHLNPISGSAIRESPYQNWKHLIEPVKDYFRKRVCICGPESTGKSTLSEWLTKQLDTRYPGNDSLVPEYARTFLEHCLGELSVQSIVSIAKGQAASEQVLKHRAGPVQIIDTGVKASKVWSEFLFGQSDPALDKLCQETQYDVYLLCSPDVPWVKDDVRYLPEEGEAFFERLKTIIQVDKQAHIQLIRGDWQQRRALAWQAVLQLIS